MALRHALKRLTTPVAVEDANRLRAFCDQFSDAAAIADVEPRQEATVVGEIASVRIVPRAEGSPWLEATVRDGTGHVVAMWTGRKKIAGIHSGQRLVISGRGSPTGPGGRLVFLNPQYELL